MQKEGGARGLSRSEYMAANPDSIFSISLPPSLTVIEYDSIYTHKCILLFLPIDVSNIHTDVLNV